MNPEKTPERKILHFEDEIYDLCHKHGDKYISIDIRMICGICEKSPPNYILFQAKLLNLAVKCNKNFCYSVEYSLDGVYVRGVKNYEYRRNIRNYIKENELYR